MIRHTIAAAIASLACCHLAAAQPSADPVQQSLALCRDGPSGATPTGTALCARAATDQADRRIASLLGKARSPAIALRKTDLAAAQTHWRRYRDLQCGLFDREDGSAGSQTPADIELCRLDHTLRREAELKEMIDRMGPR